MKVYLLVDWDYCGGDVRGVFSTHKKAEEYINSLSQHEQEFSDFTIDEWEVK